MIDKSQNFITTILLVNGCIAPGDLVDVNLGQMYILTKCDLQFKVIW